MPDDMLDDEDVVQPYEDDNGVMETAKDVDGDHTPENMDEHIGCEVMLPHGGENARAVVKGRKRDPNGIPIGTRHNNPILDTREYEVEFLGSGSTDAFTTNLITENLYSQVDDEGRHYAILKEIIGHRTNGRAVKLSEGTVITKTGRIRKRITTIC